MSDLGYMSSSDAKAYPRLLPLAKVPLNLARSGVIAGEGPWHYCWMVWQLSLDLGPSLTNAGLGYKLHKPPKFGSSFTLANELAKHSFRIM